MIASFAMHLWQGVEHTFLYRSSENLKSVSVAGTFNGWNSTANPMNHVGGVWKATLRVPAGMIQYKFVLDGNRWIVDPNARKVQDGGGNTNSEVLIVAEDLGRAARKGDGQIAASVLNHELRAPYVLAAKNGVRLGIKLRANDVEKAQVVVNGNTYALTQLSLGDGSALASALIPLNGTLSYVFKLSDGQTTLWFGPEGAKPDEASASKFKLAGKDLAKPQVPAWPAKTVIYQIFPDRFENGNHANDPKSVVLWNSKPTYDNHFGGDFAGVLKRLDYLKDLGVGAIYFNPVFKSRDNHRYAIDDYFQIEPELGTEGEFVAMTKKLKANGIRTILDGVFNHTSTRFFAFRDVQALGPKSAYTKWYFIHSYPVVDKANPPYEAWAGFGSMPKLNVNNSAVRNYLLKSVRYWDQKAEIAGWRLDSASEVTSDFWKPFRNAVKADNQNRWIVGEVWSDADKWLRGDQFDSVTGYQFRYNAVDFIALKSIGPREFARRAMETYRSYPPEVAKNLMNLLGSHDTERFLTACGGDARRAKLGAALLLTWPGAPMVYYGDELGLAGGKDPDNRRSIDWSKVEQNPMRAFYRTLIHARNTSRALQVGEPKVLLADDSREVLAYSRTFGRQVAVVAINRSARTQRVKLNVNSAHLNGFLNVLEDRRLTVSRTGDLSLSLSPESAAVLLAAPANASTVRSSASAAARPDRAKKHQLKTS